MQYAQHIPCKVIDFSLTRQDVDLYRKDGTVYLHELALFEEKNFHVVGDYNLSNAMIASCMAYKLGVSVSDIQKAIAAFSPVEHRLEYIGEKNGVKFYNDSKATNTHAVAAALNSFDKNIILLAGGHDKGISFEDLKQYDERVKLCVAFGEPDRSFRISSPVFRLWKPCRRHWMRQLRTVRNRISSCCHRHARAMTSFQTMRCAVPCLRKW
ncbi:MAG: glutamate ligase domain-containing protein [Streptococcus sp.]